MWSNRVSRAALAVSALTSLLLSSPLVSAVNIAGRAQQIVKPYPEDRALQKIVTWDEHSIFVHGERVFFYSGDFHPFRLPSPSLWLDVFQKIKALGYSGVSFYTNWALLEGEPGVFRADGIFALDEFFSAAQQAGIYLLARPGPYINAEVSGGGFPGWLQTLQGQLRTPDAAYLNASAVYVKGISNVIAKAQITNGGPVILLQPENEYSSGAPGVPFPDHQYFYDVEQQYRSNGIVVPFISNDAGPYGYFAPGTGLGAVDIYGHDGYPLGFNCANPYTWPANDLPTDYHTLHEQQSPSTPYSLVEFQGGSFDFWGGTGFAACATLLGPEFETVFYKNNFGFGVTIFNIYMTYGGTNWGNLGEPEGYTSYDYGAAISEDRTVSREKYAAAKLLANFVHASPAYLTASPGNGSSPGVTDSTAMFTTPLIGNGSETNFYVARQANYASLSATNYTLNLPINGKTIKVPQLGGQLTLNGRDSKIHVTEYQVGSYNLTYSTADIFTWKASSGTGTTLLVYGGAGELHEIAFANAPSVQNLHGPSPKTKVVSGSTVVNWPVSANRTVLKVGKDLFVYLLDRYSAYNYWVIQGSSAGGTYINSNTPFVIAQAGYLLRTANVSGSTLSLTGDLNVTAPLEVVSGAPKDLQHLVFNGQPLPFKQDEYGVVTATLAYSKPSVSLPSLQGLEWKYHDSLPEVQPGYSDAHWPAADVPKTAIQDSTQLTPTSLFGGDYGFFTGALVYRGHFVADGQEKTLSLSTAGGAAYAVTAFLNATSLGSFAGQASTSAHNDTFALPALQAGQAYVFTVVVDTNGLEENGNAGNTPTDQGMKAPRGILNYSLSARPQSALTWKITGNLGGVHYADTARGPLNEGGLYAERQGWHQPGPPSGPWQAVNPVTDGLPTSPAGSNGQIGFFTANFTLSMPRGYDIPLSFVFGNDTAARYRAQLFVNGYQFGKFLNSIGPQTAFPVPEGVLDYHGQNTLALTLWSVGSAAPKLRSLELTPTALVQTGFGQAVQLVPAPKWTQRPGAY